MPNNLSLNYADTDYNTVKQRLKEIVPLLTDKWTDFNESDIGMVLIDLLARLVDMNAYRRERQAHETLLPRARERKNVKDILKIIGYKMRTWQSAYGEGAISLQSALTNKVTIPKYTQFYIEVNSDERIDFTNLEDIVIYPGITQVSTVFTQGTVFKEEYRLSDISDGKLYLPNQRIASKSIYVETRLTESPNSEKIIWQEVDDVVQVMESGYFFSHDNDKDGNEFIEFHALYRSVLTSNSVINVYYVTTLGPDGKVGSSTLNTEETIKDEFDTNVTSLLSISISNTTEGKEPETIEEAKRYAPVYAKTMGVAVTLEDYKLLLETRQDLVVRARALDWNYDVTGLTEGFKVNLYVVPAPGKVYDSDLVDEIRTFFEGKRESCIILDVLEAEYVDVDITVKAYVSARSLHKERVEESLNKTLDEIFDIRPYQNRETIDFGSTIWYTQLVSKLQMCDPEIIKIEIEDVTGDIHSDDNEIIRLTSKTVEILEV